MRSAAQKFVPRSISGGTRKEENNDNGKHFFSIKKKERKKSSHTLAGFSDARIFEKSVDVVDYYYHMTLKVKNEITHTRKQTFYILYTNAMCIQ